MAIMGKYCKAYPIAKFREYAGWTEKTENVRKDKKIVDGKEVELERQLTDDDHLFLQENYVVTDGVFKDENIIFDAVTVEWENFCRQELKFEIPDYAMEEEAGSEETPVE